MKSLAYGVILLLVLGSGFASNDKPDEEIFVKHYRDWGKRYKNKYPNRRRTQLYSRTSAMYIQVTPKGKVVAQGEDGDTYADLEILTVAFGKVHIRGKATSRYICFDKRGRLIAKKRDTPRCIWREQHDKDAYTMYESEVINGKFISFSRKGVHRYKTENRLGTKAVHFVERPRSKVIPRNNMRYYASGGKNNPISPWMMEKHKKMAKRYPNRWKNLWSENNPGLNPLLNGKNSKKNRKNRNRYRKKATKRVHEKDGNQKKTIQDTDDDDKFPPRKRYGAKKEKD